MWLIELNVSANEKNCIECAELGKAAGAYVSCFISFPEPNGAQELAKFYATKHNEDGWRFKRFAADNPCVIVKRNDIKHDAQLLACFDEAKTDGYSLLFRIYPRQ